MTIIARRQRAKIFLLELIQSDVENMNLTGNASIIMYFFKYSNAYVWSLITQTATAKSRRKAKGLCGGGMGVVRWFEN